MKIHHLRSASFVIESNGNYILVDPMLGEKGSLPPFSVLRFKRRRNPTVDLPENATAILTKVNQTLITHSQTFGFKPLQHSDHLDAAGELFLRDHDIPIVTPSKDKSYLEKYQLNVVHGVHDWQTIDYLGGKLTAIPAQHGHGWIHKFMANGCGFYLELPNEPSLYISGDTVLNDHVKRALTELKPDITVVAAGEAQMDVGKPLLMSKSELISFIKLSPGLVVANHMEALNHCPVDRKTLLDLLKTQGLDNKVLIPLDGDVLDL